MPAYYLEIALVVLGLVLLLAETFTPPGSKRLVGLAALAAVTVVFFLLLAVKPHGLSTDGIWRFYSDDKLALFYKGLALVTTAGVLILSLDYAPVLAKFSARAGGGPAIGEFYCLPLFVCTGMMWMASAIDLSTIFLSLELTTIGFYILVAFMRRNVGSLEAGVKYLILGALSTGFLVYGFTWLYGVTGQVTLSGIAHALPSAPKAPALFAFALILVALSFKVAAVPFHLWVPDVYQGAPTPITAFLSVGSKAAGFAVAGRLLEPFLAAEHLRGTTSALLMAVAAATLVLGNLAAIPQSNFKRLLGYSSIAHAGFLLLALGANTAVGSLSPRMIVAYYLAGYLFMSLTAFAVLVVINRTDSADDLKAFNGLHHRSRFLAFAITVAAASLAGVPLTAGFTGKFLAFSAAAGAHQWALLAIAAAAASAGFYYYFKVLRHVFWNRPAEGAPPITVPPLTRLLVVALITGTFAAGIFFQPFVNLLR